MAVDPLHSDFDRAMSIRKHIGMLVLVTSTGFVAPGVDVAIVKGLGLSPSVSRAVVNFMGCAAAMNGLRLAADFVRAHPDSKALVCCVELSSVNAVYNDDINDVIISSLFADGSAAMVVGSPSPTCEGHREQQIHLMPGEIIIRQNFHNLVDETSDGITLGINHNGITCELSPNLPSYIYTGLAPVINRVLAHQKLSQADVHLWAIHPGGPKIIEESVRSLGLDSQYAAKSWEVLRKFGNMLSASLPFVLEQMIAEAKIERPLSRGLAFSFAPGITVEGMVFEVVGIGIDQSVIG
ncbi:hypothetical protein EYZ11_006226 [Aspergillus tanneri]|uniref:Type III Polyketide synthases (Type III PKS) n=1 Tax=Aspergillus tanneri TaxID=1220188 RepID=A0A4S3JGD7_9EURO|nr:hypothetical protein EYZ11_006226 [Aspergillus tanneri]